VDVVTHPPRRDGELPTDWPLRARRASRRRNHFVTAARSCRPSASDRHGSRGARAQVGPELRESTREQARVGRARLADGERADGTPPASVRSKESESRPWSARPARDAEHRHHGVARPTIPAGARRRRTRMITSTPRDSAPDANSAIQTGVRAPRRRAVGPTPNCSSTSTACFIVLPVGGGTI